MDVAAVFNFDDEVSQQLHSIRRKVELLEGKYFKLSKDPGQLKDLIKAAATSENSEISGLYHSFLLNLQPEQKRRLSRLGVDLDFSATGRTKSQTNAASHTAVYRGATSVVTERNEEKEGQRGKKRVVYRGQVKWV